MKHQFALAACAALAATGAAAGPFDQFKGKMKEGLYEYKMEMDMGAVPGMPPGMGKQTHSFEHCVTRKDIEEGGFNKRKDAKQPENCEIKNMKVSGDTATYTMECKGDAAMKADNKITFLSNGFDMDMKMQMNRNGHVMNMNQKMQGRLKGPCK